MMANRLPDDELDQVSGGKAVSTKTADESTGSIEKTGTCPKCGYGVEILHQSGGRCVCMSCGEIFSETDLVSGNLNSGRC
jgi:hypothetical protein